MKKVIVAIDLGGTNTKIAMLDFSGRIIGKVSIMTGSFKGRASLINAVADNIAALSRECGIRKNDITGAGIGLPGLVDFKRGHVFCLTNIPGWKDVPLRKLMKRRLNVPIFVDNDVNIMALGEWRRGAGRGCDNVICMTLGTGVGGALILGGKLYRGVSFAAGEIGHIPINETGPKCGCGGMACLESYVSNRRILEDAGKRMKADKRSLLWRLTQGDPSRLDPKIISAAAGKDDALALAIWRDAGIRIGIALAGVINLFNPERVIIGGGISEAGEVLFRAIRGTVNKRAMKIHASSVSIVRAALGQDAGLIGAGELVKMGLKQ